MRSFYCQVLALLIIGSSLDIVRAHEDESLMEKSRERNNLRGSRELTGSLPRLGSIENKEIPTWVAKDMFVRPDEGYEMYGLYKLHKSFRKQKYPLQLREGMKKVFDDGVIEQIEGNDADSYTLKIKPSSICDYSREDVEDSLDWTAESMIQNGASKYKVYLDVEDLKATDFMPKCMGKWSGIFDSMEQAKFPLTMDKVIAYPVPDSMVPAAQSLLNFASGDAVLSKKIVGTNKESELSNKLGLPLIETILAGGAKKYINKKKKKILPQTV